MPFLEIGMKVDLNGRIGTIVKADMHGLRVIFDSGGGGYFHPTWETTYYDAAGEIIRDYKKKTAP